jgi:hypothetical protein
VGLEAGNSPNTGVSVSVGIEREEITEGVELGFIEEVELGCKVGVRVAEGEGEKVTVEEGLGEGVAVAVGKRLGALGEGRQSKLHSDFPSPFFKRA